MKINVIKELIPESPYANSKPIKYRIYIAKMTDNPPKMDIRLTINLTFRKDLLPQEGQSEPTGI